MIIGRSAAVTRPGSAATTASTAFTSRIAVMIIPESLWSPVSPRCTRSSTMFGSPVTLMR